MAASPPLRRWPSGSWRGWLLGAGVGLLIAALLFVLRPMRLLEDLEATLLDLRTRALAASSPADAAILLVQVEESDVARVRRALGEEWPWSLSINAALVDVAARSGARAILVDMYHLDRGAGPDELGQEAPDLATVQRRRAEAEQAAEYGAALARSGHAAVAFELNDAPEWEIPVRAAAAMDRLGLPGQSVQVRGLSRRGANLPVLGVLKGARLLGFANVVPDADGVLRRFHVVGRWKEHPVLSLPLAGAALASGNSVRVDRRQARLGDTTQRLMEDGSVLLSFRGAPRTTFQTLAPAQLLEWALAARKNDGEVPPEARSQIQGKTLIFGVNLAGVKDVHATPMGRAHDGIEIQATALSNLLAGDGRVLLGRGANGLLLLLLTVGVGALLGGVRRPPVLHVLLACALVLLAGSSMALFANGLATDLFTPALGLALTWGAILAARLFTEGRTSRWLESAFGRYVAPSVVEALKRDPALVELGGRRKVLTILFSDLEGFTSLSERLPPEAVVDLINAYLSGHCDAVLAEGGVVDKFEGDAVMAFFGDPLPMPDHAARACRVALRVRDGLHALDARCHELGVPPLKVRIGINSGEVVVGNMGSLQRFDYTCMGDAVNVASRLEGANKGFQTSILVSDETRRQAGDAFVFRTLTEIQVKGRQQSVRVHELVRCASPDSRHRE